MEMRFPREFADAQKRNLPLVMVGGTVEYHGPHCFYGCDSLIAEGLVDLLSKEKKMIVAPTVLTAPQATPPITRSLRGRATPSPGSR